MCALFLQTSKMEGELLFIESTALMAPCMLMVMRLSIVITPVSCIFPTIWKGFENVSSKEEVKSAKFNVICPSRVTVYLKREATCVKEGAGICLKNFTSNQNIAGSVT
eukprot:Pompholyxophrys_punicea_v1_NODE_420_length_2008_cov_4.910906.p5 type:complete len:108 gc:universal NODE_420_length_2008_cov_4.910906:60-383(+)